MQAINERIKIDADASSVQREMARMNESFRRVSEEIRFNQRALGASKAAFDKHSRSFERLSRSARKAEDAFDAMKAAVVGVGLAVVSGQTLEMADRFDLLTNRLRASTELVDEFNVVQERLIQISTQTGSSLESNAQLFQRLTISAESLGATKDDMLALTATLADMGRVSGASVEDMKSATIQLSQSLSSTQVQWEELSIIADSMPQLIRVIEKELGYLPGQLKAAVADGEVLNSDVFRAILNSQEEMNRRASELPLTFSQASQALNDRLLVVIGKLNQKLGITRGLADVFHRMATEAGALERVINNVTTAVGVLSVYVGTRLVASFLAAGKATAFFSATAALLFSPAGLIAGAAALIAALTLDFNFLEEQTDDNVRSLKKFTKEMANALSMSEATGSLEELKESLPQLNDELKTAQDELARLENQRHGLSNPVSLGINMAEIETAKAGVQDLQDQIESTNEQIKTLQSIVKDREQLSASRTPNTGDKQKEAFEKIREQYGDQRKLAEEAYRADLKAINSYKDAELSVREELASARYQAYQEELKQIEERDNKDQNRAQKAYESLQKEIASERELLGQWYEERLAILENATFPDEDGYNKALEKLQAYLISKDELLDAQEQREIEREQAKAKREEEKAEQQRSLELQKFSISKQYADFTAKFEKSASKDKIALANATGKELLGSLASSNEKIFKLDKGYRLAEAAVNTATGVTAALSKGIYGIPLAAVIAAQGIAQIRAIEATKFNSPSIAGTTGGSIGGSASAPQATSAAATTTPEQPKLDLNITIALDNVEDDQLFSGKTLREFTEQMAQQIREGVTDARFA